MDCAAASRRGWNRAHADRVGDAILSARAILSWEQSLRADGNFPRLRASLLCRPGFDKTRLEIGRRFLDCGGWDWRGRDTLGFLFSLVSGFWGSAGAIAELHLSPALALLLVLMPIFNLPEVSFLIWPLVFCVDLLAILLAVATGSLLSILIVLLLTFVVIGGWIFRIPVELTGLPTSLFLLGGFAIFFMLVTVWACRLLLAGAGMATTTRGKLFGAVT